MVCSENQKQIFTFLKEKGCCLRCCLRIVDDRMSPDSFRNPTIISKDLGYITDEITFDENVPCIICLGILQDPGINGTAQQIIENCKSNYNDINFFSCTLAIPVSITLRERSMHIYIANNCSTAVTDIPRYQQNMQSLKDIWRWCTYPILEEGLQVKPGYLSCSGFTKCKGCVKCIPSLIIDVFFFHPSDEEECSTLFNKCKTERLALFRERRRPVITKYSRKNIGTLLDEIKDDDFKLYYPVPPELPTTFITSDRTQYIHGSIYIGGRYTKLSRKLCQTPWNINGEKKMETSLQEILFDSIAKYVNADSMKFLSSGREDVDVRMLHSGRPFAVELINPKSPKISETALANIVSDVNRNKDVKIVSKLQILSLIHLKTLKEGENEKTKNYQALCMFKTKPDNPDLFDRLNEIKKLDIVQKTPIRVLHRRPLMARNRTIYEIRARRLKEFGHKIPEKYIQITADIDDLFVLDVQTQAGTYVKEFVHGDFGRTKPSLCDLLKADVDIIALDVTGINLVWP